MKTTFAQIALAAAMLTGCASQPAPAPLPASGLWSLVKTAGGNEYVTDYDLSIDDCAAAMMAAPKIVGRVTYACELQGAPVGAGQ